MAFCAPLPIDAPAWIRTDEETRGLEPRIYAPLRDLERRVEVLLRLRFVHREQDPRIATFNRKIDDVGAGLFKEDGETLAHPIDHDAVWERTPNRISPPPQIAEILEHCKRPRFLKRNVVILKLYVVYTPRLNCRPDLSKNAFGSERSPYLSLLRDTAELTGERTSPRRYERESPVGPIPARRPFHIFLHRAEIVARRWNLINGLQLLTPQ